MIDGDHVAKAAVQDAAGGFEVFEVVAPAAPMAPPHVSPWSGVLYLIEGRITALVDGARGKELLQRALSLFPDNISLLKQAAGIPTEKKKGSELIPAEEKTKGSGKYRGFRVSNAQVLDIAKRKIDDLNARDVEHAARIVAGTARSMGITVEG